MYVPYKILSVSFMTSSKLLQYFLEEGINTHTKHLKYTQTT